MNDSTGKDSQWHVDSSGERRDEVGRVEIERRKQQRRTGKDQRDMIRFELDKDDRRSGKDRRLSVTSWGSDDPV